jgi:hypothetical protein
MIGVFSDSLLKEKKQITQHKENPRVYKYNSTQTERTIVDLITMINQVYVYEDFHLFDMPEIRFLTTLCILANETLIDGLELFTLKILISRKAQFHETIESQIHITLTQFRLSTHRTKC